MNNGDIKYKLSDNADDSVTIVSEREVATRVFDEIERRSGDYLTNVRLKAKEIVETAKREIEQLKNDASLELQRERDSIERRSAELDAARKTLEEDLKLFEERRRALENEAFADARDKGYEKGLTAGAEEGFRQGEKKAEEEFETRIAQSIENRTKAACEKVVEPLHKLIREMNGSRQALLKNWEENIMQIAAAIAYQTILREPSVMREASLDLLREALELAMNCATLKIRMNPNDVEALRDQIRVILEETGNLAKSEVVADPKITPGGCLVETSLGVVDERLESRLERIVAELSE